MEGIETIQIKYEGKVISEIPKDLKINEQYGKVELDLSKKGIKSIHLIEGLKEGLNKLEKGLKSFYSNNLSLNLSQNQITKIEGLEDLQIPILNLSQNQISKIEGLESIRELRHLELSRNQITKIEGLEDINSLLAFYLDENQISTLEGLLSLSIRINTLGLSKNQISSTKDLEYFQNLHTLDLSDNPLQNFEELKKLTRLKRLTLWNKDQWIQQGVSVDDDIKFRKKDQNSLEKNTLIDFQYFRGKWASQVKVFLDPHQIELYFKDTEERFPLLKKRSTPQRTDRKSTKMDFEMELTLKEKELFNKLVGISLRITTDRGDSEELYFGDNIFTIGKSDSNSFLYRSRFLPMKIDSEYKLDPGVVLIFSDLKAIFKEQDKTITQDIPIKGSSTIFIENKGKLGRFFDNIMAKLVFVSFIVSATSFLSEKSTLIDSELSFWIEWISYGLIGLMIIAVLLFYSKEMHHRKKEISKKYENVSL